MMSCLKLFFPQWQGGTDQAVLGGALLLRAGLGERLVMEEIAVDDAELGAAEENIRGRAVVLRLLQEASGLLASRQPDAVLTIGGDCSVSIAPIAYLNERYGGDLTVVWLDAHGDLNSPEGSVSKLFHGMPLRILLGAGDRQFSELIPRLLSPRQVVLAGTRELDPPEADYVRQASITVLSPSRLAAPGSLEAVLSAKGCRNVFIHVDTDVLDPGAFGSSACPSAGGMDIPALEGVIRMIEENYNIVGLSVVEFTPFDDAGRRCLEGIVQGWPLAGL